MPDQEPQIPVHVQPATEAPVTTGEPVVFASEIMGNGKVKQFVIEKSKYRLVRENLTRWQFAER